MKDPQDSAGHNALAPSANQVATTEHDLPLTRDSPSNRQSPAHGHVNALAPAEFARDKTRDKALARDQTLITSALAHGSSESDSDDDAVVFGRSVRNKTKSQKNERTSQSSADTESVDRGQRNSGVSEKDKEKNPKKSRGKKKAGKKSAKKHDDDGKRRNTDEAGMFAQ